MMRKRSLKNSMSTCRMNNEESTEQLLRSINRCLDTLKSRKIAEPKDIKWLEMCEDLIKSFIPDEKVLLCQKEPTE